MKRHIFLQLCSYSRTYSPSRFFVVFICILICSSCKTINGVAEAGGSTLESISQGYVEIEKTKFDNGILVRHLMHKGKGLLEITSSAVPFLRLYTTEPDSLGNFFVTSIKYLAGNYGGWNEFTMDSYAKGIFLKNSSGKPEFTLADIPVQGEITSAS
ncbi:MAG: hypothetical protein LBV52_01040, partial [Spirochaetaceae bacterium]|nr:hypothetical protein [Spirochaetaceae bacterium]